jgi:hypothetical protein
MSLKNLAFFWLEVVCPQSFTRPKDAIFLAEINAVRI